MRAVVPLVLFGSVKVYSFKILDKTCKAVHNVDIHVEDFKRLRELKRFCV